MLHNSPQVDQSAHKQHLPLVCLLISSLCILKRKTIISNIPMCYAKYHIINNFPLKKVTYVVD